MTYARARLVLVCFMATASRAFAFDGGGGFRVEDGVVSGTPQVDVYNYSGSSSTYTTTWTKPYWATAVYMWCVGGGPGGKGGSKVSTSSTTSLGGDSSFPSDGWYRAADLPSTLSVTVGKGATGGNGATTNGAAGSNGGVPGESFIGVSGCSLSGSTSVTACYVYSHYNNFAGRWRIQSGGSPTWSGATQQPCTGLYAYATGSGAGGGTIAVAGVAADGYDGSAGCFSPGSGGAKGTVASPNGSAGSSYTTGLRVGGGGGGGASSVTAGVNGGIGGDGGVPGGGGGGGGAGLNDVNNGGKGGAGGNGQCVIVSL